MNYKTKKGYFLIGLLFFILIVQFISGCNQQKTQVIIESIPNANGLANCYILGDIKTGKAAIIDTTDDLDSIENMLKKNKLSPEIILLTHGHFDHIGGIKTLKDKYKGIKVYVHNSDSDMLSNPSINMSESFINQYITAKADGTFKDSQIIKLENTSIKVIHTPGHTPGSVTFSVNNVLFTGDTLFKDSIGRTDFPGSSEAALYSSIKEKLLPYPDATTIYPGHGESSTIGAERKYFQ